MVLPKSLGGAELHYLIDRSVSFDIAHFGVPLIATRYAAGWGYLGGSAIPGVALISSIPIIDPELRRGGSAEGLTLESVTQTIL